MKHSRVLALVVLMFFVACGDDSTGPPPDDGGNNNPQPQATAPGTPNGTATTATIGAAGGTLASDDGLFAIDIPAGALSSDTTVTIQPITNTAWGGVGNGYRLEPNGLTFAQPIDLVFDVAPEILAETAPAFLDVAVQNSAGFWYVLKNRTYDDVDGTLTCTTTHFSDYSNIEGVQIRPGSATVGTSGTVSLYVRICTRETIAGDPDLTALVYACDDELAPLSTISNWSVNGISGGNNTVGRVASTGTFAARYTAPASVPQNNPVAVSVETNFAGASALLVCTITIGSQWTGTATAHHTAGTGDPNDVSIAEFTLTWTNTYTFGDLEFFAPTGTVTYTPWTDCSLLSFDPDSHDIVPAEGMLQIDHSTDPPTFFWYLSTNWPAQICIDCGDGPTCGDELGNGTFQTVDGDLSSNGTKIIGYFLDITSGDAYNFEFTRQ